MHSNIGIAATQNYGINYAVEHNYNYLSIWIKIVLFLDIISKLLFQYRFYSQIPLLLVLLDHGLFNRCENKEYKGSVKGKKINNEITEVSELISSASLIAVSNFEKTGLMDEELFIDGVDHEWCWRASSRMNGRFIVETSKIKSLFRRR